MARNLLSGGGKVLRSEHGRRSVLHLEISRSDSGLFSNSKGRGRFEYGKARGWRVRPLVGVGNTPVDVRRV